MGFPLADPLVGLVITVAILAVLRTAARDVFARLMDGVDPELVHTAEVTLAAQSGVLAVRTVRLRWTGHRLLADAELDVDPTSSLAEAHDLAHRAETALTQRSRGSTGHWSTRTPGTPRTVAGRRRGQRAARRRVRRGRRGVPTRTGS